VLEKHAQSVAKIVQKSVHIMILATP
jgi:hypothetical protein